MYHRVHAEKNKKDPSKVLRFSLFIGYFGVFLEFLRINEKVSKKISL